MNQDEDPHNSRHKGVRRESERTVSSQAVCVPSMYARTCNLGLVGSKRVRGRHGGVGGGAWENVFLFVRYRWHRCAA